nr:dockerin type I repeat-containing protein [Eubacteriales bacterium]
MNGDGLITSSDAVLIIRHGMGLVSLFEELLPLADVNSDGTVNTADAVTVMRMSMGL